MPRKELRLDENAEDLITLSSGVTVAVLPFPTDLWPRLNARTFQEFPEPVPPKKKIKVVDGFEEIDDTDDPEYQAAAQRTAMSRINMLGEAVMDLCVRVDLEAYKRETALLAKYRDEPLPEDPDTLKMVFLADYALRTPEDTTAVVSSATSRMFTSDPEVAERLRFFRRKVARPAGGQPTPPGPDEKERVELRAEVPRA